MRLLIALAVISSGRSQTLDDAVALWKDGKPAEAQHLLKTAVPRLRATGARKDLARALSASAETLLQLGDYATAIGHAQEAILLHRQLGDRTAEAQDANALGLAHLYLGDYSLAAQHYRQALDLDRATGDGEGEVIRLNNLANVDFFRGRYQDALRAYESALDRIARTPSQSWAARQRQLTMANLATLYQRLGRRNRALELYRGLQQGQDLRPSERARMAANQGALLRRLGDPYKALSTYRTAQQLFARERHRDGEIGVLRNIGIVQALDLGDLGGALTSFRTAANLAVLSGNRRGVLQARLYEGETLRRMGDFQGARRLLEPALEEARRLQSTEEEWRLLYALGQMADPAPALALYREAIARIESVRSRLELPALRREFLADKRDVYDAAISVLVARKAGIPELFDAIERSRGRMLRDRYRAATLGEVQSRLPPGTLLLEYWCGSGETVVLGITRTAATARALPSPAIQPLLGAIASTGPWREQAAQLGSALLPAPLPPDTSHILIIPDGPFADLPFETLISGGRTLVERAAVYYAPTAAVTLDPGWGRTIRWSPPWTLQLLAFADPVPGPQANLLPEDTMSPLPHSREEAHAIARQLAGRSQLRLGFDARKSHLAFGAPLLHFATHAVTDPEDPESSRIVLSFFEYLFLREIYSLDLSGTELVTLSACDTAAGKLVPGEGVESFSRAFLGAGARSTVTTLWRVPDASTAEFMKQFYYRLGRR